ncbi:hypothetical protein [Paenibacillus sp. OV219]|uniref:hypothetical protein n=1 Tax=Paenibacillus sp. OV219 TaxID=1884377 RepID=UPI0008C76891|nr:hypothetical protein [Paenibacillus sp. OV219]SEM50583.1 hypothetical protein SAMN05518847_10116 [Paenibacillus sp. OV219]
MTIFSENQSLLLQARKQRELAELEHFKTKEKLARIKRDKAKFQPDSYLSELEKEEATFEEKLKQINALLDENKVKELSKLELFLPFTNPIDHISKLDDRYPILMFPLRIETRFKTVKEGSGLEKQQLWVRVFPDEIAIDSFEELISENEVRNAKAYWTSMWQAGDIEAGQRGAWRSLVNSHGSGRAYWIVQNYRPLNGDEKPERVSDKKTNLIIATEEPPVKEDMDAILRFWSAMWQANGDKEQQAEAWTQLVDRYGDQQAQELWETYKPTDFPFAPRSEEDAEYEAAFLVFPKASDLDTKFQAWAKAPKVRVLPERFVLQGYTNSNDKPSLEEIGNVIPSSLSIGPNPSADEGEPFKIAEEDQVLDGKKYKKGDLIVSDELKWMVDFEEAIAKGMGFRVDLTPEQAANGFNRLFVVGVRLSTDPIEGKNTLETLIDHHHHSRKGFGLIPQGTPTNNTEQVSSAYSWREDADDSFDIYFKHQQKEDSTAWADKSDGLWLAQALGIDNAAINHAANYYGTDQSEARAIQTALWPATLGYFMETMMAPVFSEQTIARTKDFFQSYVSGRGMIPTIRVGKQPYGILPVAPFSRMNWFASARLKPIYSVGDNNDNKDNNASYYQELYGVLKTMDDEWTRLLPNVSFVGKTGDDDPHQTLLDVLGLHPTSVEFHSRHAQSFEHVYNVQNLQGTLNKLSNTAQYMQRGKDLLVQLGYNADSEDDLPDVLKMLFFERNDLLKGPLIDDVPLSEFDAIRSYTKDNRNYIDWLIAAAHNSHDTLRSQQGFIGDKPPTALLYLMVRHALDLGFIDASLRLHASAGILEPAKVKNARKEPKFIQVQDQEDLGSRWQHLYKYEPRIMQDGFLEKGLLVGDYIPKIVHSHDETSMLSEQLKALEMIKDVPTARLERIFTEHLDVCAYRLDAWMLGLANAELAFMRGIQNSDGHDRAAEQGVYIGAYGWLEDVRPENKKLEPVKIDKTLQQIFTAADEPLLADHSNQGYIHAPSLNQAVTAAVLRNGYIANASASNPGSMAVNLSSERVRQALSMIEGIRNGQSLAALLGYKLERGLHDRHDAEVDAIIFDLRNAFPLNANRLPSTKEDSVDDIRAIEARNVVDGLALVEQIHKSGNASYPFGLAQLPAVTAEQRQAIDAEVERILDINDAVADLAVAEGVHQAVQGNYDRAAASMDAFSKGNFPPIPDVIRTPRSGVTLNHRVGLHFNTGLDPADASNATLRSKAEPAVNEWLSGIMPPMDKIVCIVAFKDPATAAFITKTVSMQELGLLPIDVLYMGNMESEQAMTSLDDAILAYARSRYNPRPEERMELQFFTKTPDETMTTLFELAPLLSSARTLLLRSRPLTAGDMKFGAGTSKPDEVTASLNPLRITLALDALGITETTGLRKTLKQYAEDIAAWTNEEKAANIETILNRGIDIYKQLSMFGLPHSGYGHMLEWRRRQFEALFTRINSLITRWDEKLAAFDALINAYGTSSDKLSLLQQTELTLSTESTQTPLAITLDAYKAQLINGKRDAFLKKQDAFKKLLKKNELHELFAALEAELAGLSSFDAAAFEIEKEKRQLIIFADDMQRGTESLRLELDKRALQAAKLVQEYDEAIDANRKVAALLEAGKLLFGDDFRIVPEFSLSDQLLEEWTTAFADSEQLLAYQKTGLNQPFPIDDWLYGVARVRDKMRHVENMTMLADALIEKELKLESVQFPYRKADSWLALEYPASYKIDEDKLLYTAMYPPAAGGIQRSQCGILIDEWTEVIPAEEETTGIAFHYDRPNSEAPQSLLLVMPSDFKQAWQWQDVVDSLHDTLNMAKKRAVEPSHIDSTDYARFLPALLSAVTVYPVTAALPLALNNEFYRELKSGE